jgi:chloride channel protein, CIC family
MTHAQARAMTALDRRLIGRAGVWLHGSASGLMALAVVVGLGAGLGAVFFRELIVQITRLLTGFSDYSTAGRVPNPHLPILGIWFVFLVPILGGLVYGPLISRFAREARGHGVPEVMLAVAENGGRIRPRVAAVKSVASAICIGCGGSVGREGPIVQIGSAIGSTIGQVVRVPDSRMRLLVACGAAGGISATFNAPIAGVFFALELILRDFEVESFGVVVLSSVVADVIGRAAFGAQPFLQLPAFQQVSVWEYALYAALGLAAALLGTVFIRALYGMEDLADRVWRGPQWARPAVGGVLLGGLLLAMPQLYGVGYPVLETAVGGHYALWLLLGLCLGKLLATSLTIAIGGSGGVFAPSLFMGAMFGTAYGDIVAHLGTHAVGAPGAYGLVGMGAVFAAASRAPITAVLIIFELTGDYHIILPLMVSVVLATALASVLTSDSIYTLKLRRRGIDLRRARPTIMQRLTVADAMQPVSGSVTEDAELPAIVDRVAAGGPDGIPVTSGDGSYLGIVKAADLDLAVRDDRADIRAGDLAISTPALQPMQTLDTTLSLLSRNDIAGLPVVVEHDRLVGWITHRDILRAYSERMHSEPPPSAPKPGSGRRSGKPSPIMSDR